MWIRIGRRNIIIKRAIKFKRIGNHGYQTPDRNHHEQNNNTIDDYFMYLFSLRRTFR